MTKDNIIAMPELWDMVQEDTLIQRKIDKAHQRWKKAITEQTCQCNIITIKPLNTTCSYVMSTILTDDGHAIKDYLN